MAKSGKSTKKEKKSGEQKKVFHSHRGEERNLEQASTFKKGSGQWKKSVMTRMSSFSSGIDERRETIRKSALFRRGERTS